VIFDFSLARSEVQIGERLVRLPNTASRVPDHTPDRYNDQIRRDTRASIAACAAGGRVAIERRLEELDREWDIERALENNASVAVLVGLTLGITVDRRWLIFPAAVAGFLLQHALQGWCPPLPVLRRLGFRTADEIAHERYALKALRGDFQELAGQVSAYDRPALERVIKVTAP